MLLFWSSDFDMSTETISCVYKIVNAVNRRVYVGSTGNFRQRSNRHFKDLRNGAHRSRFLQRDYDKCGREAFSIEILELVEIWQLLLREQAWIDALKPDYNLARVAGSCRGVSHRPEVVAANRERNSGFGNGNARLTPAMVAQIIAAKDAATTVELAQRFGVHRSTIERALQRAGATKRGRVIHADRRAAFRSHAFRTLLPARRIAVSLLDDSGAPLREFESMTLAAKFAEVDVSTLCEAIKFGRKCAGRVFVKAGV